MDFLQVGFYDYRTLALEYALKERVEAIQIIIRK